MELSRQQHAELARMARYFGRIEEIAEHLGVEVDMLIDDCKTQKNPVYEHLKKTILQMADKRKNAFRKKDPGKDPEEAIILNFSVHVNEDRFLD